MESDFDSFAPHVVEIIRERDILAVQRSVLYWAKRMGLNVFKTTRLVTAASELARNVVLHAGKGCAVVTPGPTSIEIVFEDAGPGIADMEAAMRNGFSTAGSLGLGLPGASRLVDEFHISSIVGKGTRVRIAMVASR